MNRVISIGRRCLTGQVLSPAIAAVATICVVTVVFARGSATSGSENQTVAKRVRAAAATLGTPGSSFSGRITSAGTALFLRGDVDCNSRVDNDDLAFLDAYFNSGGTQPSCMRAADINADGTVTTADLDYLDAFLSGRSDLIPPPFPFCGIEPTPLPCDVGDCPGTGSAGYLRGDVNGDHTISEADLDYLEAYLFDSAAAPPCMRAADLDLDDHLTVLDWVTLTSYLNGEVEALPPPFPECGAEPQPPYAALPCNADCCTPSQTGNTTFIRGDVDADGEIDSDDVDAIYDFVINAVAGACLKAGDINLDQTINIIDWAILTDYVNGYVDSLPAPFPNCGTEPVETLFPCEPVFCEDQPTTSVCECDCIGDPVCDGICDVIDVTRVVEVAFRNGAAVMDPNASCPYVAVTDLDCSGTADVLDVVRIVNVAFRGGNASDEICNPCNR